MAFAHIPKLSFPKIAKNSDSINKNMELVENYLNSMKVFRIYYIELIGASFMYSKYDPKSGEGVLTFKPGDQQELKDG